MNPWFEDAFIYHLFPLGTCGAPWKNPGGEPVPRMRQLVEWIEPATRLGTNAVLFGPFWESGSHGYDTHDYFTLDRRLGTNADLTATLKAWKDAGFRLVFDGVLNHSGRGFAPFVDLLQHGRESDYIDWFTGVDFSRTSPLGDPFWYEGWSGHHSLVKFNLKNSSVREYLLGAVAWWIEAFDLDGLRLDAADVIDKDFLRELSAFCKAKKPDFWLMGEVVHGDYNLWAPQAGLDAVTNYELFKGLWSSLNDANYFEVAWTLNRQFGENGIYRGRRFATFGDNHDVDRVASNLANPAHLYPHAILSATVPGIPMVYYGSEVGLEGRKAATSDAALRPSLHPSALGSTVHQPLRELWSRLATLRKTHPALRDGDYRPAWVDHHQLAFWRIPDPTTQSSPALVVLNSASDSTRFRLELPEEAPGGRWRDVLNPNDHFTSRDRRLEGEVSPCWGRILIPA